MKNSKPRILPRAVAHPYSICATGSCLLIKDLASNQPAQFCATHFESHNSISPSIVVVAWETRNGRQYYYKKVRCGKKVVSQYIGCGPEAEIAELSVKLQTGEKNIRHESESEWDQINELLEKRQQEINRILQLAGLHKQNCGPWRKKRMQRDRITKRS